MNKFVFHNPVKIFFGKNMIIKLSEIKKYNKKILIVIGKGSIKKNGILDRITTILKDNDIDYSILENIKSNPEIDKVYEGIDIVKKENIGFILAAGGGSVIDTSKAIAVGSKYSGDVWDFYSDKAKPEGAIDIGVLLTIAATGSEMNSISVITNPKTKKKVGISSPFMFPKFSILDPELTVSVPENYTAYSSVDIIAHAIEGYFTTKDENIPIQDGFVETIVNVVIDNTKILFNNDLKNIEARTNIMWASTLALNGLLTAGIGMYDFQNHVIGHGLSALYDTPHGAALSVIIPAWMKVNINKYEKKFARFGRKIFNLSGNNSEVAKQMVEKLEAFFKEINAPVRLKDIGVNEITDELIENAIDTGRKRDIDFDYEFVKKVYEYAKE